MSEFRPAVSHLALVLLALVESGCAKGVEGVRVMGHVAFALTLPSGDSIDHVVYRVTAGAPAGIPDAMGTIDVNATQMVVEAALAFPASTGDTVTLDAVTSTGAACHGVSPPFDLPAGASATANVVVACAGTPLGPISGSVRIVASVSQESACPQISAWRVAPAQIGFDGTIDVSVTATAPPGTPVFYSWEPAASFLDPASATTKFHCTTMSGVVHISAGVSNDVPPETTGACATAIGFNVTCAPPAMVACNTYGPAAIECERIGTVRGVCLNTTAPQPTTLPIVGCGGFAEPEGSRCLALIECLRASGCADGDFPDDPTPCLCGAMSAVDCVAAPEAALTGPCRAQYVAAAGSAKSALANFYDPSTPEGVADNLFSCDVDAPCGCSTNGVAPPPGPLP